MEKECVCVCTKGGRERERDPSTIIILIFLISCKPTIYFSSGKANDGRVLHLLILRLAYIANFRRTKIEYYRLFSHSVPFLLHAVDSLFAPLRHCHMCVSVCVVHLSFKTRKFPLIIFIPLLYAKGSTTITTTASNNNLTRVGPAQLSSAQAQRTCFGPVSREKIVSVNVLKYDDYIRLATAVYMVAVELRACNRTNAIRQASKRTHIHYKRTQKIQWNRMFGTVSGFTRNLYKLLLFFITKLLMRRLVKREC